jgi:hypothetical protein
MKAESAVVKSTYYIQPGKARGSHPVDQIRLRYNVPVRVDESGNLVLTLATGEMKETRPMAWQEMGGERAPVEVGYRLMGEREVGFRAGSYDSRYDLVIDPVLIWNTFLGGTGYDFGYGITVNTSGNVYVTGESDATWGTPLLPFAGSRDAFVAKLDANGALQWNTFLGGTSDDAGYGIAVDTSGNCYVIGHSLKTWGSPGRPFAGGGDAFVAKLDPNGALQWHTFLGGSGGDRGYGIAVDTSGNAYVTGQCNTNWGSPVRAYTAGYDAFVAKLDTNGALQWNTFLGGTDHDYG